MKNRNDTSKITFLNIKISGRIHHCPCARWSIGPLPSCNYDICHTSYGILQFPVLNPVGPPPCEHPLLSQELVELVAVVIVLVLVVVYHGVQPYRRISLITVNLKIRNE